MKIRRIKKAAATIGLVVVVTLMGFALGLAQDSAPLVGGDSFGLHHSFPAKASSQDDYDRRAGLIPKPGHSQHSLERTVNELVARRASLSATGRSPAFAVARARKIPLHLLDSILLI